jgi:hypothetical protein
MMDRRESIRHKLYSKVVITPCENMLTPCHIFTGSDSGNGRGGGYGRLRLDGGTVAAHIANWVNEKGIIPSKKQLDHLCENRKCIAIDHMELVTHKQNQRRKKLRRKLQK